MVRILTRAWWTHEDQSKLWSRRSWRCRRWPRLCLLLQVVYPVLKTFCERLEVLELFLPARWHLLLLLVVKEKQGEWAKTRRRQKQWRRELRIRHAMRTDHTSKKSKSPHRLTKSIENAWRTFDGSRPADISPIRHMK